ncbi:SGNH hydrolase-type esterase domain-containing protein [Coniochaeta sp. 2T2.1]|nr:SGNH hydrolase-type esterase domain-containing protein [Coniochaeta sp. 2T2.1]
MPSHTWLLLAAAATLWTDAASSYAVPIGDNDTVPVVAARQAGSASVSLGFVQRWAAIGDSYTAGIGSGERMGTLIEGTQDWLCSRYTYTYPNMIDRFIGSARADFQYPACSGARTGEIFQQARALQGNLDVVMLTAGGNDLCLEKAAMIRKCVILPYDGESVCTQVITKAQENINTILKPNIREILNALKPKMRADGKGIVVYSGYAPFFSTENEDCADPKRQEWSRPEFWSWQYWFKSPLRLTIDRRRRFNELVENINQAIRDVVAEFRNDRSKVYDIAFSDWSEWPAEVDGQFCSPRSTGWYPDAQQPELVFIKSNTHAIRYGRDPGGLRRRDAQAQEGQAGAEQAGAANEQATGCYDVEASIYDSLLYKSPDPGAVALHRLDARAPAPPSCSGDGGIDPTLGLGLPDTFGRIFHPNEKGHEAIAAFALENLAAVKAKQDGKGGDMCTIGPQEDFKCWQQERGGNHQGPFVRWETLDGLYRDFCERDAEQPPNTINWRFARTYHSGTPEEVEFVIQLSDNAYELNRAECVETMYRIINSCDGNDDGNPLNLKFGGRYSRGAYTYEVNPKKDNRVFFTRVDGNCRGEYKYLFSDFEFEGRGWNGVDAGEKFRNQAKRCVGGGLSKWKFEYHANPADHNGWEWYASFRTPIWVALRCFDNLKVQKTVGGYTHRRRDPPSNEVYETYGCAGNG